MIDKPKKFIKLGDLAAVLASARNVVIDAESERLEAIKRLIAKSNDEKTGDAK